MGKSPDPLALMEPGSRCYGLHVLRYTDAHQFGRITSYDDIRELTTSDAGGKADSMIYGQHLDFSLRRPVVGLSFIDGQHTAVGISLATRDLELEAGWLLPFMYARASALVGPRWPV